MPFGAHEHRVLESISVSLCSCDTKTHQRTSTPQSRKPCRQTHGFLSLNRVQGGSACAGCKGKPLARSPEAERSGPRHFAGFRRKTESVIVGSYTFAESAVPPSPRAPNKTHHTHERKEVLPWQETMAWIAPPSAPSPERRATSPMPKPTTSDRRPDTETRISSPNAAI